MRMVVDLPAPLGPRKPVTVPGRTVKSSRSTAVFSPYLFVSCLASIMRVPSVGVRRPADASPATLGTGPARNGRTRG